MLFWIIKYQWVFWVGSKSSSQFCINYAFIYFNIYFIGMGIFVYFLNTNQTSSISNEDGNLCDKTYTLFKFQKMHAHNKSANVEHKWAQMVNIFVRSNVFNTNY